MLLSQHDYIKYWGEHNFNIAVDKATGTDRHMAYIAFNPKYDKDKLYKSKYDDQIVMLLGELPINQNEVVMLYYCLASETAFTIPKNEFFSTYMKYIERVVCGKCKYYLSGCYCQN